MHPFILKHSDNFKKELPLFRQEAYTSLSIYSHNISYRKQLCDCKENATLNAIKLTNKE
uniref:Uncharacterized protein n=1 Tax=Octopus bimaculoides TaxID=37653 RepID=A0A0L8GFZ7_OCTBM